MRTDTIFLLIEYSGIPVALMLYSIIIKQLSNSDPIPSKDNSEEIWSYGLELMVITSVSTLLYGISFAGHTNGEGLSSSKLYCIIWCLCISIIEFFFLIYFTLKVRQWGKKSKRTKLYPNLIASLYLAILVVLVIVCSEYTHHIVSKDPPQNLNPPLVTTKRGNSLFWLIIFAAIIIVSVIILLFKHLISKGKKKVIEEYTKGTKLITGNPATNIQNLQDALKKLPENSPLIIDIRMKLSKIFSALSKNDEALKQIELLEETSAYKSLQSYLRDGIIKSKFLLLLELNKVTEAEMLISLINSKEITEKLMILIYEKKRQLPSS